ncbi:MAG: ComEC family competence protein [Burkholderiales bacterium]|nr:ComEC family competence protein [Flavobacterium sp.]
MKVLQFPLAKITLWFVVGIWLAHNEKFSPELVFSALSVAVLILVFAFYDARKQFVQNFYFGIAAYGLSFCIGLSTWAIHNDYLQKDNYIHKIKTDQETHVISVVLREKLKSSSDQVRYIALVQRIDGLESSGKIIINLNKNQFKNTFCIGNQLQIKGTIFKHKRPQNPNQFDYGEYLINKSVLAQMYPSNDAVSAKKFVEQDAFYYSDALRNRILTNLDSSGFRTTELNIIAALILGQQQDIDPEILYDYQVAGAIHILSVSGLHVGFLLLFLNFLLRYLPNSRSASWLKLGIVLFSLWGFAILAGLSPSVIRSVTMFSFVALGMHLKRKTNVFHTLLVSAFLILLFEPSFLFDVGFQLSYVALFFILWWQPILSKLWAPDNKVVKYFWEILTVSLAAQMGTLPLSIYYFHQFPGLFFATNLIVIPFLSIIMGLGLLVMVMAAFNFIPVVLSQLLEWSVWILNKMIHWIASFKTFIIQDISFNSYMLLGLYALLFSILIFFEKPNFKKGIVAIVCLFIFQSSYIVSKWSAQNQKEWIVFNSKKSTLIAERDGFDVTVYSNQPTTENKLLKSYLIANFCTIQNQKPLKNVAYFNGKKIIVIDSLGVYPKNVHPDIVVIRQSPKINLERVLLTCKPTMVVADGSNFKSAVNRWQGTCQKAKIPFHATAEKGFYRLQ